MEDDNNINEETSFKHDNITDEKNQRESIEFGI